MLRNLKDMLTKEKKDKPEDKSENKQKEEQKEDKYKYLLLLV